LFRCQRSLPFTLGVGLLSRVFGGLADEVGARLMLIAGPLGAALGYGLLALGKNAPFVLGVLVPMVLLDISFAVPVAPLTASVPSSVKNKEAGLASGVNNAVSRIAKLAGVALTAGVTSYAAGFVARVISCDVVLLWLLWSISPFKVVIILDNSRFNPEIPRGVTV
jgi:MFS family permease